MVRQLIKFVGIKDYEVWKG